MTKKDKKTLGDLSSMNRFMVYIAADPRGYETTEMTVRSFFHEYRRFFRNNELDGCLTLQEFAGQLHDFGIRGVVRDASLPFEMLEISKLRDNLINSLGLNKRFFVDPESLEAAIGKLNTGITGSWSL